ncbi:alginate lyase family protein [Streptomyces calvus]
MSHQPLGVHATGRPSGAGAVAADHFPSVPRGGQAIRVGRGAGPLPHGGDLPHASSRRSPPDGSQPQQLARTRSRHYSAFTLVAHTRLAAIGQHVGADLWATRARTDRACSRPSTTCSLPPPGPPPGRCGHRGRRLAAPGTGGPPLRRDRRRPRSRRRGGQPGP